MPRWLLTLLLATTATALGCGDFDRSGYAGRCLKYDGFLDLGDAAVERWNRPDFPAVERCLAYGKNGVLSRDLRSVDVAPTFVSLALPVRHFRSPAVEAELVLAMVPRSLNEEVSELVVVDAPVTVTDDTGTTFLAQELGPGTAAWYLDGEPGLGGGVVTIFDAAWPTSPGEQGRVTIDLADLVVDDELLTGQATAFLELHHRGVEPASSDDGGDGDGDGDGGGDGDGDGDGEG